jgi:hypothetical protein
MASRRILNGGECGTFFMQNGDKKSEMQLLTGGDG